MELSFLTCEKETSAKLPAQWRTSATYRAFFLDARHTHRTGKPHREKKNWFVPNFILPQSLVVQQRTHSISKCCETCQHPVSCQFSPVLDLKKRLGRAREGAGLTCPGGCYIREKETWTCSCSHPPPLFPCTGSAVPTPGSLQV